MSFLVVISQKPSSRRETSATDPMQHMPLSFLTLTSVMHFLCNCPKKQTECSLCETAARLLTKASQSKHITLALASSLIKDWSYSSLFVFKALNGPTPSYFSEYQRFTTSIVITIAFLATDWLFFTCPRISLLTLQALDLRSNKN